MPLPIVAISAGDPSGISPEIVIAALKDKRVSKALTPIVFGDASLFRKLGSDVLQPVSELKEKDRRPGKPTLEGGHAQWAYFRAAISAAMRHRANAICTAPVSKEQITRAGIAFFGHTEVLAEAFGRDVLMLMSGPKLKVALATNHLPISKVPRALKTPKLVEQITLLHHSLGKQNPRIAVCGLNPHAGEGGILGREEIDVIAPAIAKARKAGIDVYGPFPADGLFARAGQGKLDFDVVLAMFHDQALVAAKVLDFVNTVNVTLGLPVPRTSPDHGVAYDIAGKGEADPEPMVQALLEAARLSRS